MDLIVSENTSYNFFLENLEYHINNSDIKTFKDWECFGTKGLYQYTPLLDRHFDYYLNISLRKFTINDLKDPVPNKFTKDNKTDITIVRNVKDLVLADIDLNKYNHILEIGGGYGALANVILNSGYQGTYTIYDFALMEKVYKYYIQHPFTFIHQSEDIVYRPKTLLISTWGISEIPSKLCETIIRNSQPEGYYVIAQNYYDDRNNSKYFINLLNTGFTFYDENSIIFVK